jgi:glycosyltransferase involved in cell wall biosynthesis
MEEWNMQFICFMPAYNTGRFIEGVIRNIPPEAWDSVDRLLVVNDGSTDHTAETVLGLVEEFPKIRLVQHELNRGYGAAQKTAFDWARKREARGVVMLHSDGQYPPDFLVRMLAPLHQGADVVGGSRTKYGDMRKGGMSQARYWGTVILNGLENFVFRANLTSYHSGYKAYSMAALEVIPYHRYSNTFNFDSEMLVGAIRNKLSVTEVPIPTVHGQGYSSLRPVPYGLSVLHTIWKFLVGRI